MSSPALSPGDRVVKLAGVLRSSAVLAGAIALATCYWLTGHDLPTVIVTGLLIGGLSGFAVGWVLSRVFFPARGGHVLVVKLTPGVHRLTIKAGIMGGVGAGLVAGMFSSGSHEAVRSIGMTILIGVGILIGITVGALLGYLASRP